MELIRSVEINHVARILSYAPGFYGVEIGYRRVSTGYKPDYKLSILASEKTDRLGRFERLMVFPFWRG